MKHLRGGRSLWRWVNESRNAELVVVLGEDVAALLGLSIAFVFVVLAEVTGDRHFDAFGSLAIGVLLVVVAVFVGSRVKTLLIGRSADPRIAEVIESEIGADPAILWVYNVITLQIGPQIMLAAKVRMRDGLAIEEACEHINRLERRVKERIPEVRWSFIEPDVDD